MSGRPPSGDRREPGELDALVARAREGDRDALEALVRAVQDGVYNLALRMLWHPADAEDATQEILIKVVTRLDGFRGEAALTTWVHRIAANHLLATRRSRGERQALSFGDFGRDLAEGQGEPATREAPDEALLAEEVKVGCTHGMLLCLDREQRLAYILGEVFGLESQEAAAIAGVAPAAFRKRLSRARQRLRGFMEGNCGLVNPERPCRCRRRIDRALALGRIDPDRPLFATRPRAGSAVAAGVREMEVLHDAAAVFRSHPVYAAPERIVRAVTGLVERRRLSILEPRDR